MRCASLLVLGFLGCAEGATPVAVDAATPGDAADVSELPTSRDGCEGAWQCEDFGQCTNVAGQCLATTDADCQASLQCTLNGLCHAQDGCCAAEATPAGCEQSYVFRTKGTCPLTDPFCQTFPADMPAVATTGAPTYRADAQPILRRWCGACHGGDDRTVCAGKTCLADHYADGLFPSLFCEGMTMVDCALVRLENNYKLDESGKLFSESGGVILIPKPLFETLKLWGKNGFPEE